MVPFLFPLRGDDDGKANLMCLNSIRSTSSAVDIIAIVRQDGLEDRIIVISQFRPPTQKVCLEIPSGGRHHRGGRTRCIANTHHAVVV